VRFGHAALAGLAIVIGLVVHLHGVGLGPAARDMTGDALWAAMITWVAGVVAPAMPLGKRSAVAFGWCVIVETSQLLHSPGLDAVRATLLGQLVLGSGFDARDLLSYALGVLGAAVIDIVRSSGPAHSGQVKR
jgi:hypothetical protein